MYSPQSCKSRSLHSLLPATFILVFLDTVLCILSMALQPWLWHWQCQAAANLFPELFSSVPPYSWHAHSGGSKSCTIAADFISGKLCTGLKSGWRSRAFPSQKGEAGLNFIVSGLCRKVFWFGSLNMEPEVLNTVFKSWPNDII